MGGGSGSISGQWVGRSGIFPDSGWGDREYFWTVGGEVGSISGLFPDSQPVWADMGQVDGGEVSWGRFSSLIVP